jgi:septum formation protein
VAVLPQPDPSHEALHHPSSGAPTLVLASASPRRRELLAFLGFPYTTLTTTAEERDDPVPDVLLAVLPAISFARADHPTLRAWRKASDIASGTPATCILGADTTVALDDAVLNKPNDAAHACAMLAQLAGRTHTVYTGLCVIRPLAPDIAAAATFSAPPTVMLDGWAVWLDLVASAVEIAPLSAATIADYVATGEPLDKAGSYGIQGLGGRLVRSVQGSYTNVVGLPLAHTRRLLSAAGIPGLTEPEVAYTLWLNSQGKEPLPCPPTLP